jgi:glucokinase
MNLYGDIGGTKTQLAVANNSRSPLANTAILQNKDFTSFEDLLAAYLEKIAPPPFSKAILGVAGPVHGNACNLTNLDWKINGRAIAARFNIDQVELINDLTATAYAIPSLDQGDFLILQNSLPLLGNDPVAVISVGTGLGESVLIWEKTLKRYLAISGEGGHRNFAPRDKQEINLLQYLLKQSNDKTVATENIVSGKGIVKIYQYLCQTSGAASDDTGNRFQLASEIVDHSNNIESVCHQTIEIFANLIANEASNIALQYLSTGGVIIAGGIPPKIASHLASKQFLERFRDKGRFSDWLQSIPVAICTNYQAPLIGAQFYSSQL